LSSSGNRTTPDADAPVGSVVIVVPTYNERENLESLAEQVLALDARYQLLIVDDNSPDGTGVLADELAARFPGRVGVQHRPAKAGLGRAYVDGLSRALREGAPIIAQMDADHSHQPADLHRLVAAAAEADLVLGSRYIEGGTSIGWPWHRRLISRCGGLYAKTVLGVPIHDMTGGFKVWRRDALAAIDLPSIRSDGYCFQIETTWRALRADVRVREVPITFIGRVAGKSKLSRRVVIEAALLVWRLRLRGG
jgi:dolichol-phosphate mannosyltransferase